MLQMHIQMMRIATGRLTTKSVAQLFTGRLIVLRTGSQPEVNYPNLVMGFLIWAMGCFFY